MKSIFLMSGERSRRQQVRRARLDRTVVCLPPRWPGWLPAAHDVDVAAASRPSKQAPGTCRGL